MKDFIAEKNGKLSKLALMQITDLSFSALMSALKKKDVKINGKRTDKDINLNVGDKVEIYYKPTEKQSFSVVFFDTNILVVNKYRGVSSEFIYEKVLKDFGEAYFIHRLDTNTAGLMIFALNSIAEKELLGGFKSHSFYKAYHARVKGVPKKQKEILTAYLFKNETSSVVTITDKKVKGSVLIKTGYKIIKKGEDFSDLLVTLFTGKTHQIRAHLAHIGHPVLGDGKYDDFSFNSKMKVKRQMLTATNLTLYFEENSPLYYLNGKSFTVSSGF